MPFSPGQHLDEFHIVRCLGEGGFGTVYLAQDTLLHRPVAIKELRAPRSADDAAFQRFLQEARTAGGLNHPNIVTVHGLRVKGDSHYLILEYVPGGSLRERLKRDGKLKVSHALQIAVEICEALTAVHAKGIVHRDIKPENILLTEDDHAKVTDFGIAHVPRETGGMSLTQTGFQPGTILYMSPEQIRGEAVTGASDVYQVATVLHEMVTGRHYFDANALLKQAMQELKATNPLAPAVQARWMSLVGQAIEGRTVVKCSEHPELAHLLEEVFSSPAGGRLDIHQFRQRLQSGYSAGQRTTGEISGGAIGPDRSTSVSPHISTASVSRAPAQDIINRWVLYILRGDSTLAQSEKDLFNELRDLGTVSHREHERMRREAGRLAFLERLILQGLESLERRQADEAISTFTRAIEFEPAFFPAWAGRGAANFAKRDLQGAIDDFSHAIELNPNAAEVWLERGAAHTQKGEDDEAIADLSRAVELGPNEAQAWACRGQAYGRKGEYDAAIADLSHALELGANYAWTWAARGNAYMLKGFYDAAIADLSRALELDPNNAWALQRRAEALVVAGSYKLAISDIQKSVDYYGGKIEQDPTDPDAYNGRAWALLLIGKDIERAVQVADSGLSLKPQHRLLRLLYGTRGTALAMKGDLTGALRDFDESLRSEGDEANYNESALDYYLRGIVRQRLGDAEGAEGDFARAKTIDPNIDNDPEARILSRPPLYQLAEDQERTSGKLK